MRLIMITFLGIILTAPLSSGAALLKDKYHLSGEELEAIFQGEDREKKLEWIWRIPNLQKRFPEQARELAEYGVRDGDEIIRQNTLLAIEDMGGKNYFSMVESALGDKKESVRWFARYAAEALTPRNVVERSGGTSNKGTLECKYSGMIGYYGPHTPGGEWSWKDMDEFMRLGYGYVFSNAALMLHLWCPDKPSWKGGRVDIPPSFWQALKKYEEKGIDFFFVFELKPKTGWQQAKAKEQAMEKMPPGWQSHFYEKDLDREIRKSWDHSAPPGWTLLDEFRLHVRNIMMASKRHGDMIDGWLFFSEPSRFNYFGDNYENVGLLINAGIEEAKKISPEAYLGIHGIVRPRLERLRYYYANGATQVYAAAFRKNMNSMPEAVYLEDEIGWGGGLLETFNSFYTQAKKWGISDPRDGKTKVVQMERFLNVIGEGTGPTFGPRTFLKDTQHHREKHADYWARSVILALSTGYVCKLSAVFNHNPFWTWGSPSGIGTQYDVREVRRLRDKDIASAFEKGKIPPKPKDMRKKQKVMKWTFYEIYKKKGREGLYTAMDRYLENRRPDMRKSSYFSSMILNHLLGRSTCISRLQLVEPLYGFRFRDDGSGRMVTALWWAGMGDREVTLFTEESELKFIQRIGNRGIMEETIEPAEGKVTVEIGSNPVYMVGEIIEKERIRVNLLSRTDGVEKGERGIFEIVYQAEGDMSGGMLEIEIPEGWISPQVDSRELLGYVTVEPGPAVRVGRIAVEGSRIQVPLVQMWNGHTLRLVYGDSRHESYLYDMGEDQFGPVSMDHVKMQGNMVYYKTAGDGFDHEGLPRAKEEFWSQWPSAGGCGIPDNDPNSIHRDMALSATYKDWEYMVDVNVSHRYQVKIFLNGSGDEDDQLSSQRVTIGDKTFDSKEDRIIHDVDPDSEGQISVMFKPDRDGNSMNRFFGTDIRENIVYSHRKTIPDNTKICYVYGIEIIPEHLGGGPAEGSATGINRFKVHSRRPDGWTSSLEAEVRVSP
jgi:hypothetical protein